MARPFHVVFFIQVLGWVCAERLPDATSAAPLASNTIIVKPPPTSLEPMIPVIIGCTLGGFLGFLLLVFGTFYLLRRRRSRDVDNVIEGAHFPTMTKYPTTSPPVSASSRGYDPYVGYYRGERNEEIAPPVPPGLPVPTIRF